MIDKRLHLCLLSALTAAVLALAIASPAPAADTEADMKPYSETFGATDKKVKIELVPIKGGVFTLGSPKSEAGHNDDEGPQVKVQVEPFWMAKFEVTWNQYDEFRKEYQIAIEAKTDVKRKLPWEKQLDAVSIPTPLWEQDSRPILNGMGTDGMPVANISQYAARQFSKWVSKQTGHYYRLPTEAEWEYACRANTTTAYNFGNDPGALKDHATYFDNSAYDDPEKGHPDYGAGYRKVGSKKPNAWGLYDMHGNVSEWVQDGYIPGHYAKLAKMKQPVHWKDAIAWPKEIFPRIAKGGNWNAEAKDCRSASRLKSIAKWQEKDPQLPKSVWWYTDGFHVGFRIIRPLKVPDRKEQLKFWNTDNDYEKSVIIDNDKILRIFVGDDKKKASE